MNIGSDECNRVNSPNEEEKEDKKRGNSMGRAYFAMHAHSEKNRMLVRTIMVNREDDLGNSWEGKVLRCDMNVDKQDQSKKTNNAPPKNENEYTN